MRGEHMKKFIIFIGSFIFLLGVFQIISGFILTSLYQPALEEGWHMRAVLPSEITLTGNPIISQMIIAVLAASLAYFIAVGLGKKKRLNA